MTTTTWKQPTHVIDGVFADVTHAAEVDTSLSVPQTDADLALVQAAIQAGTVPTFAHDPATDPDKVPGPIDLDVEVAAYRELLEALRAAGDDGSVITLMDPDAFAKGLV